jgi:pimeloyl-ACP methyl ester carboxylesterase
MPAARVVEQVAVERGTPVLASALIEWLTADLLTPSLTAAFVKLRSPATTANAESALSSPAGIGESISSAYPALPAYSTRPGSATFLPNPEERAMGRGQRSFRSPVLVSGALAGFLGTAIPAVAQGLIDLQTPESPLVLKSQGSFFVGGEKVAQTHVQLGSFGPPGHVTVNQMYVRYMVPQGSDGSVPVVMVHGMTLTGKTWETTPDGRMGWDEYFVRKGRPVYVTDQVSRGRSGFNQAVFNDVRAAAAPPNEQPPLRRFSDEVVWPNFRFGPKSGVPYPDEQFPVLAVDELAKQSLPDMNSGLPTPNPTYKALSDLATQLKGAVLMGHSQSGSFPLEASLINSAATTGLILVEPGSCPATYSDQQIAALATVPILVVFGDHLGDTPTGIQRLPSWQGPFDGCQAFIARVKAAGGRAEMLYPPDRGIRGNSHMIMQDKNNLQIADR